jgi:GNAT superfamily N-acetyltransferase
MAQAVIPGGVIRRLDMDDLPSFRAHLLRLDARSRFARFGQRVDDDFINRHAELCFGMNDAICGYYVDGILRGVGEFRATGNGMLGGAMEAAFSVEPEWRRSGLGAELLACILHTERDHPTDVIFMPPAYASSPMN